MFTRFTLCSTWYWFITTLLFVSLYTFSCPVWMHSSILTSSDNCHVVHNTVIWICILQYFNQQNYNRRKYPWCNHCRHFWVCCTQIATECTNHLVFWTWFNSNFFCKKLLVLFHLGSFQQLNNTLLISFAFSMNVAHFYLFLFIVDM